MTIVDTYGVIISPHPIPNDLQCSWTLNAGESASRGMALKFLSLDLKGDTRTNPTVKSEDKFMASIFAFLLVKRIIIANNKYKSI